MIGLRYVLLWLIDRVPGIELLIPRGIEPEMVEIPPGSYLMGDSTGKAQSSAVPVHEVKIKPFAIEKYEVTFEEYDRFALATGRSFPPEGVTKEQQWGRGNLPVGNVSWFDAVAYAKWLSDRTGKHYRLPTESEWEYAARAGSQGQYWKDARSLHGVVNCFDCASQWSGSQAAPVGSLKPNAFKLFDMIGNVWELVDDCWHESYTGAPNDGSPWREAHGGDCNQHVMRGGSYVGV